MSLDFNSLFGDSEIPFDCPKCGREIIISVSLVGSTITCPKCKVKIDLQAEDSFEEGTTAIDKSLNNFEKSLKNFGK